MGCYVEPPPGIHPCLPPDNGHGRNQVGNIYEALVGLYWLEDNFLGLTDLFLTLMDLDQIEYVHWSPPARRTFVGFQRGANALRCSRYVFVHGGRTYGYHIGGPAPALGAMAEPRLPWLQKPSETLWIPEWQDGFAGAMPQGEQLPAPPPPGPAPRREWPRGTANDEQAASSGDRQVVPTGTWGPTPGRPCEGAGRTPRAQEVTAGTDAQGKLQEFDDPQGPHIYPIYHMQGDLEPRPNPDRNCAFIMVTRWARRSSSGSCRAPAGPRATGTWSSSEQDYGRHLATGSRDAQPRRAQEPTLIFTRQPCPGIFPRAPQRPCRFEEAGALRMRTGTETRQ